MMRRVLTAFAKLAAFVLIYLAFAVLAFLAADQYGLTSS